MATLEVVTFTDEIPRKAFGEELPKEEGFNVVFNIEIVPKVGSGYKIDVTVFPNERLRTLNIKITSKGKDLILKLVGELRYYIFSQTRCELGKVVLMPSPNNGSKIYMRAFGRFRE